MKTRTYLAIGAAVIALAGAGIYGCREFRKIARVNENLAESQRVRGYSLEIAQEMKALKSSDSNYTQRMAELHQKAVDNGKNIGRLATEAHALEDSFGGN